MNKLLLHPPFPKLITSILDINGEHISVFKKHLPNLLSEKLKVTNCSNPCQLISELLCALPTTTNIVK